MLVCCLVRQMVLEGILEYLEERLEEIARSDAVAGKSSRCWTMDEKQGNRRLLKAVGEEVERLKRWNPRSESMLCG